MTSVNKRFLIVENMLNFGSELLMDRTKIWRFKRSKFLCKTLLPTWPKRGLVDNKTTKRSCVLNETLDDLMRGALEQDIMPNW